MVGCRETPHFVGPGSAHARTGQRGSFADLIVADRPIAGLSWLDYGTAIEALISSAELSRDETQAAPLSTPANRRAGVREYVAAQDGDGWWDYFRLSDYLSLSITEAVYRKDRWISVEGGSFFKIRVLLAGRLLSRDGTTLLESPQAQLHVCAGARGGGYKIAGQVPTTLVVLHCGPELLSERLGLPLGEAPDPLRALAGPSLAAGVSNRVSLTPELFRAAQWIHASRYSVLSTVRAAYLEALSMEMVCQIVTDLSAGGSAPSCGRSLLSRDRRRVHEARDYLSLHYASPPTIPQLARMVGMNQTKLKAAFKQLLNVTIYEYVLQRRMEVAAQMLVEAELSVAEIAYRVGYDYPANFSCAFKRYYGRLPRDWKHE
ncbi:MAG: helix-turn-helix transcriptional regulator [Gammaproteobacteria bacterium]|nr:MAG: helix-turn-helix transcriptional regulator [Gammaproteobacteria bacterium]